MAHIKSAGTTRGNRDSIAKRRGVKRFGGEIVIPGNIIIRQKGTKFHPGEGVGMGNDFTISALKKGAVVFNRRKGKQVVSVE